MNSLAKIFLKKSAHKTYRYAHPWIYRSQIEAGSNSVAPGDLVRVCTGKDRFLGVGYFNLNSEITVRLLTTSNEPVDKDFFKKRLEKALGFRKRFVRDTNAFRIISSEADGLPGLIVDQYANVLVVQFLTLGMDRLRPFVAKALAECLPSCAIYEKSDSSSRRIEGLEEVCGWIKEGPSEIEITEGQVRFKMVFGSGHKTGFYMDQRENRLWLADLGSSGDALDAFCYTGGFGLHLAKKGWRVLGVDSQEDVIKQAQANRQLNAISPELLQFRTANVFDELKAIEKAADKLDMVILDPPSFVKKKQALEGALSGYKEIILRGMKILKEDGLLAVFSCSYHVDETLLLETSLSAAVDLRKNIRIIKFMKQSADHPIHPFIPETYYLKGFLFQITSL